MKKFAFTWMVLVAALLALPVWAADTRGFGRAIPAGEKRVALVIGNNEYAHVEKLKNAVADAKAMKQELARLGFDVVFRQNADRNAMNDAVDEFLGKLSTEAVGLVFYAGHGVQIKSANYLIPVDVQAEKESQIINNALDVGRVTEMMADSKAKFSLVVLDACRDNPFKGSATRGVGNTRGLAQPSSSASGVMVVYSAGANQRALDRLDDRDRDPNGLFTREFLKAIREPGVTVKSAVENVRQSVITQAKAVGHMQTPAIYDQSTGSFFFTLPSDQKVTVTVEPKKAAPPAPQDQDALFWQSVKESGDPAQLRLYLQKFPSGEYAELARLEIKRLEAPPPPVAPVVAAQPQAPAVDDAQVQAELQRAREESARQASKAQEERAWDEEVERRSRSRRSR
ncbi:MAG: caspase family protein [Magnetococcales bacterium]|nr:caspase family protein [Magnetococcales bacterium]